MIVSIRVKKKKKLKNNSFDISHIYFHNNTYIYEFKLKYYILYLLFYSLFLILIFIICISNLII